MTTIYIWSVQLPRHSPGSRSDCNTFSSLQLLTGAYWSRLHSVFSVFTISPLCAHGSPFFSQMACYHFNTKIDGGPVSRVPSLLVTVMHAVASATLVHKEKSLNATWSIKVLAGNLGQDTTGEPGKNSTLPPADYLHSFAKYCGGICIRGIFQGKYMLDRKLNPGWSRL